MLQQDSRELKEKEKEEEDIGKELGHLKSHDEGNGERERQREESKSTNDITPRNDKESEIPNSPDIPPNGGYGWLCVACSATINAHTWGLNSAYAIFLAHYLSHSTFPSATPLHYALIGGLSISCALIVSPLATLITRLYSTRTTLLIGVVFETASFVGASYATAIWHLFLTQGVCFGWGMGFLFVGSVGIAAQWFTTHRGLANGIAAAGSGLGGLIYSLAAQAMIRRIGLPWAFRTLAVIACVVNTVCALLIRDRNVQIGSVMASFDARLLRRREFVGLMGFGVLSMLAYVVLLFSLPNYARTIGLSAQQGSVVGALFNLGQALGRPPIGYFSDSFGRLNMASSMTALVGVFCLLIWMFAKSFGLLVFFAILGGTVAGTYWAVVGPVTVEVVGLKRLPSALSITWLVLVLPTTFSEAIGLEIVAHNGGSYTGAILFTGFMYLGAAICLWLVRAWKIGELEEEASVKEKTGLELIDIDASDRRPSLGFKRSPFLKRMVMWQKV